MIPLLFTLLPITNGAVDVGDPAVVAIVGPAGVAECTGTLITPRVVLTAAHCGVDRDNYWQYQVFFGSVVGAAGDVVDLRDARRHPDFDAATLANDVGVLFLAAEPAVTPVAYVTWPLDVSAAEGLTRVVGFGETEEGLGDGGTKREGAARLAEVTPTTFRLEPLPSQPCTGDSGGPAFLTFAGVEYLAGVTSRGDDFCMAYADETRVDAVLTSFVQPYLDETAPATRALGEPCLYDGQCTTGACLAAEDEPRLRYCSAACAGAGECAAGQVCAQAMCRYPLPTPGALGSVCTLEDDCFQLECIEDPDRSSAFCSRRCSPVVEGDCPATFECAFLGQSRFYCLAPLPPEGGWCSSASAPPRRRPGAGTAIFTLLALGALGALVGRRSAARRDRQ